MKQITTKIISLTSLLVLTTILIIISGCTSNSQQHAVSQTDGKMKIAVTFFPLYDLTKDIAGEKADVYSIIPNGIEPHDFEPTIDAIKKLNSADAFVTIGIEFQQTEQKLIDAVNPNIKLISSSKGLELINLKSETGSVPELGNQGNQSNTINSEGKTGKDTHIWLSPKNMILMAENIAEGLKSVNLNNAEYYDSGLNKTLSKLVQLDKEYKEGLSNCSKDTILVSHNAFAYLARDYGFNFISISGLSPELEPSPQQIKQLVDIAKEKNLKYIFYESLVDPRVSQTIAKETGAQTLELDPIEGSNDPNADYFSIMRKNLENLKIALECK